MADLIDRQALLEKVQFRLPIDSEKAEVSAVCVNVTRRIIEAAPAVDAVEVVRCEKCKSWKRIRDNRGVCKHPTFTFEDDTIDPLTEPNDFCSYGERLEDNG